MPIGLMVIIGGGLVMFGGAGVAGVISLITQPDRQSVVIVALFVPMFIGLAAVSVPILLRARNRVAVDEAGLWRLPPRGAPLFLAWRDITEVRADDVMQRLIVSAGDRSRTIWLEYQLKGFSELQAFVLAHVAPSATAGPPGLKLFHRSTMNRILFGVLALFPIAVGTMALIGRQWGLGVGFLASSALGISLILSDPLTLRIEPDGIVLSALLGRRKIRFRDITQVTLVNQPSANGNVWAAVTLTLKQGKPVQLYRYKEGSLALHRALSEALAAASS